MQRNNKNKEKSERSSLICFYILQMTNALDAVRFDKNLRTFILRSNVPGKSWAFLLLVQVVMPWF